jgi:hypothetical protein
MLLLLMDANQIRCNNNFVNHKKEEEENREREERGIMKLKIGKVK